MSTEILRRPAPPVPAADRCAFLFGIAAIQQGVSVEAVAAQIDRTRRQLERERVALAERRVRYELRADPVPSDAPADVHDGFVWDGKR